MQSRDLPSDPQVFQAYTSWLAIVPLFNLRWLADRNGNNLPLLCEFQANLTNQSLGECSFFVKALCAFQLWGISIPKETAASLQEQ